MDDNKTELNITPSKTTEVMTASELEKKVALKIVKTISLAMKMTKDGYQHNREPLFTGIESWEDAFKILERKGKGTSFFSVQEGVVTPDMIFSSTRDGWSKLDHYPYNSNENQYSGLPKVVGKLENGEPVIRIRVNTDPGTDFSEQVLKSGVTVISLRPSGSLTAKDRLGSERVLTNEELEELGNIFDDASQKLLERVNFKK